MHRSRAIDGKDGVNFGLRKIGLEKSPLQARTKTNHDGIPQFRMSSSRKMMSQEDADAGRTGIPITIKGDGHPVRRNLHHPLHVLQYQATGLMHQVGRNLILG